MYANFPYAWVVRHVQHSSAEHSRASPTPNTEVCMFTQLVVPVDGSPLAEQALGPAASIARHTGGRVDIVRVHQPPFIAGLANESAEQRILDTEDAYLEMIVDEVFRATAIRATHALLTGKVIEMICARASDLKADLIVMTSHGRTGLSRSWLGSVADGLIRHTDVPVLMLRSQSRKEDRQLSHRSFRRILVLLDGSKDAEEILSASMSLAVSDNASLVLLRVVQPIPLPTSQAGSPFGMPDIGIPAVLAVVEDVQATEESRAAALHQLNEVASRLALCGATQIESHVSVAIHVAEAIGEFAATHYIDAIAMCSHGRGASRLLMGSVADTVLRATHVPVLLYRPAGVHARRNIDIPPTEAAS